MKKVGLHEGFDLGSDLVALPAQRPDLLGQFGQHAPGAPVPTKTTVCRSRAANTASVSRSAARGVCFFNRSLTCPCLAVFNACRAECRVSRSGTAGLSRYGPSARSKAGWICLRSLRLRFDIAVIWPVRSSSCNRNGLRER